MDVYTEAEAQADADALVARLASEPGLRDALIADPRATLVDAGLRPDTVDEIEAALAGSEVEGFALGGQHNPMNKAAYAQSITGGTSIIFGGVVAVSGTSVIQPGTSIVPNHQGLR